MTALTADTTTARNTAAHPDPTAGFRRVGAAIALPLAFLFQLVSNALYAVVTTESGLTDTGPAEGTLRLYADYADSMTLASVLAMCGVLVMIPGLLGALRVVRARKPRLGLWAVGLMIAGYVCYLGIVATNFGTIALAQAAAADPGADLAPVLDASQPAVMMPFFLLFVAGNLVGTLLLGLAVILSRAVPWIAGVLIIGWPVGHIANLLGAGEWLAVAGGALEIAGLVIVAARILRMPNTVWTARG